MNRKTVFFEECFKYKGELIQILQGKQGAYVEILNKTIEQLDASLLIHKRVLVYRIDFHLTYFTHNNQTLSKFIKRLKQWIYRNYSIKDIGYVWAREKETSKSQHYHMAIFLDGNKIQHPKKLNVQIKEMWGAYGHMSRIENPFYYIDNKNRHEMRLDAIRRLSYLAKVRGKGYRDSQAKDYGTSRLKTPITKVANDSKTGVNMPRGSTKGERRGGRIKGTLNKRTEDVIERLRELDCDPFGGMATIAEEAMNSGDLSLAGNMFKELAQYVAPKRKAMEITSEVTREIEAEDLTDQQKKNLIKLLQ